MNIKKPLSLQEQARDLIFQTLGFLKEYKFCTTRKWKIDYYHVWGLAVEIEGAVWVNGRHTRGSGFVKDMEKYNRLTEQGIFLLRYTPDKIDFDQIKEVLNSL